MGYSDANDKSRGTPLYYRMNIHGHIHAQAFLPPIENVSYQNVAIDVMKVLNGVDDGATINISTL